MSDFSDSLSNSNSSLDEHNDGIGKRAQVEIINRLRITRTSTFYLIPSSWRKAWFLYCLDEKGDVEEPGKVQTGGILDNDWVDESTVLLHPNMLPVKSDVAINSVPEPVFRKYKEWYGLDGPEIIRHEADDYSMHRMLVKCTGRQLKFCVPKSISRREFYQLITEAFGLPDVDNIQNVNHCEENGVTSLSVTIRAPQELEPLDWDSLHELPLAGVIGLGNIGNTCYMASAIQALSQSKQLTMPTLSEKHTFGNISYAFFSLMKSLWTGSHTSLSGIKEALARKEHRFASYSQQDSQELLALLLDHINEEMRIKSRTNSLDAINSEADDSTPTLKEAWNTFLHRNNSQVTKTFGGLLKSQVKCVECAAESITFDPFLFLSLPIPSATTPKVPLNIVGVGKRLLKVGGYNNVGDAKTDLGFPCAVILAESGKFIQAIPDSDLLSLYVDREEDFFDFKRRRGQVYVYPNVDAESVKWVSFSKSSYIIGSEYFGFPLPLVSDSVTSLEDVKTLLSAKIASEVVQVLDIKQTAINSYSAKVPSEHVNSLMNFFEEMLPVMALSPDVPGTVSLDDCLSAFERDEYLPVEVGWKCSKCKHNRPALKCLKLAQLPGSSMMIHLKRFSYSSSCQKMGWFSGSGRKISTHVSFPHFWNVGGATFELYAVIEHYGSLFGGHYTCAARNFLTGAWHRYDDSSVREIDISSVLSGSQSSAYVLFYERKAAQ